MPLLISFVIMDYKGNVYAGFPVKREIECVYSPTEPDQAESVRSILNRFAVGGIDNANREVRGSYAAKFSDDEPLHGDTISKLMEMDDLSGMDEMELHDYLRENTKIVDKDELIKADPGSASSPVEVNPSSSQSDPQPPQS